MMLNQLQPCAQKHSIFNAGPENQNPFSGTSTLCHLLGSSKDTYTLIGFLHDVNFRAYGSREGVK